ncbi:MAG: hypothetical protein ACKO2P_04490 [Planctomycetota bacterium]
MQLFQQHSPPGRSQAVLRLLAAVQLLLMLCTWPLWLHDGRFPAVPLFSAPTPPPWLLTAVSVAFAAGCLLLMLSRTPDSTVPAATATSGARSASRAGRFPSLLAALLLCGLLAGCCNQHCLQAWHVFFLWSLLSGCISDRRRQLAALQHIPACVYVCSGLSRLSLQPEAGPTGMILGQLTEWLPTALLPTPATFRLLCHAAAWSEALVGGLLLSRGWAGRAAMASAMVLHVALLVALGPLGLNHNPAVLLWNLCFLLLLPLLYVPPRQPLTTLPQSQSQSQSQPPRWWCILLWGTSLSGLVGFTDNWPAWQLYSSRPEQWQLWIDRQHARQLPPPFSSAISSTPVDGLLAVRFDLASLQQTGSPLYPEDRFQLALIEHVLSALPERCRFRVRIDEPQRWCWWRRTVREIDDRRTLQNEHDSFWLNSRFQLPPASPDRK